MSQPAQTATHLMTPRGILTWIRGILAAPTVPEAPVEAVDRRAADRADAGLQLSRLKAAAAAELPPLVAAEAKARATLERLAPAYQEAVRTLDQARMELQRREADLDYGQTLAVRRIEAAAEPVIDEFLAGLVELRESCLATHIVEEERSPAWDEQASKEVYEVWTNGAAIIARSQAILEASRAALAMKADPDQSNIRGRLAALIEELPEADTMSKVYSPVQQQSSRRWPTYEESRAEMLGVPVDVIIEARRGPRRSKLSRLLRS